MGSNRQVLANSPVIIIKNKRDQIFLLIDLAIQWDNNLMQKKAENKLIYKILIIEIQRMWNIKRYTIPKIIGATAVVTKGLKNYQKTIPGKHSVNSLQKTANIISRVLQSET